MSTVAIDPTEASKKSRMPEIPGAVVVNGLEALTGADFMLSVYAAPVVSEPLIHRHISNGAYLVQRKSGEDLINSIPTRLGNSIARMWETSAKQCQKVLLITGALSMDASDGMAWLDGRKQPKSFWAIQSAISKWHDRGGVVEWLPSDDLIPDWCRMKLKHLAEYYGPGGEIKAIYPESDLRLPPEQDPMQVPVQVKDGRVTLATLPGIGPRLADELWTWGGRNLARTIDALCTPATLKLADKPHGIGPVTIQRIRKWMGYKQDESTNTQSATVSEPTESVVAVA